MDYTCQYCNMNLDGGDIYQHFLLKYSDKTKALASAKSYGWSETNKMHFNKSICIQPDRDPQYTICPFCKNKDPFKPELGLNDK